MCCDKECNILNEKERVKERLVKNVKEKLNIDVNIETEDIN